MAIRIDIQKKLRGFSLHMECQSDVKLMGILGASGCGKSMTLKCIAGIEEPDAGIIEVNGKVYFDSARKINLKPQERSVGFLFQNYALFPTMSVEKNILTGLWRVKDKKLRNCKMAELIERFELNGLEKRLPHELSGGQQQRVAFARILAYNPDILLLDEPFSALDTFLRENLMLELQKLLKDYQGQVILVSHNREEIYKLSQSLLIMHEGSVVQTGDTKKVFEMPATLEAARLTGCKNISEAIRQSKHRIYAADWDMELSTEASVDDKIKYIGIRAHDIRPAQAGEHGNIFTAECVDESESLFETTYILHHKGHASKKDIWWKTGKNLWEDGRRKIEGDFILPKERLLLLRADDSV